MVPPPEKPEELSGPGTAWLDADRVAFPLRARGRLPGDRYAPLGLRGTVKVQDLLVDRKIPRERRGALPIVVDQRGILWIPGFRVDERVKITGRTKRALCLEATEPAPSTQESP